MFATNPDDFQTFRKRDDPFMVQLKHRIQELEEEIKRTEQRELLLQRMNEQLTQVIVANSHRHSNRYKPFIDMLEERRFSKKGNKIINDKTNQSPLSSHRSNSKNQQDRHLRVKTLQITWVTVVAKCDVNKQRDVQENSDWCACLQCYKMINNFLADDPQDYQPCHQVYTHPTFGTHLFLGDIQSALDLPALRQLRIVTVVTAAAGLDHVVYDTTITHIVYPLLDSKHENITRYFHEFADLVERQLSRGNILVHCAAGISRIIQSATLVLAYLMRKNHWNFKEAIAFLRQARPEVCPNLGFQRQLKLFESQLAKHPTLPSRRNGSKTSQEKKHYPSVEQNKILPEINLGRTQIKPKILDLIGWDTEGHSSQRDRPRRSTSDRLRQEGEFYGTRRLTFKPLKTKIVPDRSPLLLSQGPQQDFPLVRLKGSMPVHQIEEVMVRRLELNNKKISTERQIRIKPLHKLAFY